MLRQHHPMLTEGLFTHAGAKAAGIKAEIDPNGKEDFATVNAASGNGSGFRDRPIESDDFQGFGSEAVEFFRGEEGIS